MRGVALLAAVLAAMAACPAALAAGASSAPPLLDQSMPSQDNTDELPLEGAGVVTNPDWERLPSADDMARYYPKFAANLGFDGYVRLICQVTSQGTLQACGVGSEAPLGFGFGAAALEMSVLFRMKPKQVNGVAVSGASISVPIRFAMADETDPPPPPGPPPRQQSLALARRLVAALGLAEEARKSNDQGYATWKQTLDKTPGPNTPARAAFLTLANTMFEVSQAGVPAYAEQAAYIYARTFSDADLAALAGFYESPAGQAWRSKSAVITLSLRQATTIRTKQINAEVRRLFCQKVACAPPKSTGH